MAAAAPNQEKVKKNPEQRLAAYFQLSNYPAFESLATEDKAYYERCQHDLRSVLTVYKGVRLRDIRKHFEHLAEYDLDLERLKLKSWTHFLLTCITKIEYRLLSHNDIDKEEIFAFPSEEWKDEILGTNRDFQSVLNCTPDRDKTSPNPLLLSRISAKDAYIFGFLDVAEGHARIDPRVPRQDLGVAAAETMKNIRNRNKKLTFEEQIELANNKQMQNKLLVTVETTAPLPETQTGSLDNFFNAMPNISADTQSWNPFRSQ